MRFLAFWAGFVSASKVLLYLAFFADTPRLGTAILQLIPLVFLCGVLTVAFVQKTVPRAFPWSAPTIAICAYLAWATLSLSWTVAPFVPALGYWLGLMGDIAFLVAAQRYGDPRHVCLETMKGWIGGSLLVAAVASFFRTQDLRFGDTELLHPNAIGNQFAIALLFSLVLIMYSHRKTLWGWVALLMFVALLLSLSKASILSAIGVIGLYVTLRSRVTFTTRFKIVACGLLVLAAATPFFLDYLDLYIAEGHHLDLSGRTVIWAVSLDIALENPLKGHGFYSYRSLVPYFGEFESWHAHNEVIQQIFTYGIVGLALASLTYLFLYLKSKATKGPYEDLIWMLLIYALLHGLTDASHVELSFPLRFAFMLCACLSQAVTVLPTNRVKSKKTRTQVPTESPVG